jgi:hypothetical protein
MKSTEKAIRDFCGHHADWWPSTTQVQEMLALAQPTPRPWVGLTKEEAKEISMANRPYVIDMIAALEARLKEKNT